MKKVYFLIAIKFALVLSNCFFSLESKAQYIPYYRYGEPGQLDYLPLLTGEDIFSTRIRSMDKNLAGIVSDTITDMLWNPARLPLKSFISCQIPNRLLTSLPGPFKSRWGILLEGSYNKSESEYSYPEPSGSYIYTDYLRSRNYNYSRNTYKGALLAAKQFRPNTTIGFRFDYSLKPYKNSEEYVYRYTRESTFNDRVSLSVRESVNEHIIADTVSSYSFSIGALSSIWNSDLEIILGFTSKKVASSLQDMYTNNDHDEYTYTYDSIIRIDTRNYEYERMSDKYDFLNPKIWTLDLRFSKSITPISTFRTVATIYRGSGDSERRRANQYYYYRDQYYSYTSSDTSYIRSDTSETYDEVEYILGGNARILGGFIASGQEFLLSPKISLGVGIKVLYERSEIRLEGTKYETEDTLSSQSAVAEMDIERRAYIYLPLGIEYKPIPEIALRAGFNIYGTYQFSEDQIDGESVGNKKVDGPSHNINIGAGFNWERFNFDVYARDISAIDRWDIEACYTF
jgi:hypothetical protein